jgi:enoyl-CoA hydratase
MISFDITNSVAIVTLNRPEKLNALTLEMLVELGEIFQRIRREQVVRAVILTGVGDRAFCAGTDIAESAAMDAEEGISAARRVQGVWDSIEICRVPVIAAVNGLAAGSGCELALACHIRIASSNARFSLSENQLAGVSIHKGIERLKSIESQRRIVESMLMADEVTADEALRSGVVNRVVPRARLLIEAEAFAREVTKLAPLAIRACLEAVLRGSALSLEEGLELEAQLFSSLFATEDMREGTSAFLEKRAAVFKGR